MPLRRQWPCVDLCTSRARSYHILSAALEQRLPRADGPGGPSCFVTASAVKSHCPCCLSEVISSHVLHCNKGSHVQMNQVSPADALSQSQQLLKDLCILSWAICNLQAVIFLNITRRPCRGTSSACTISIMLSCRPPKAHSVASLLKGMRLFNLCKRHLSLCQHTKAMAPGMEEREREGRREILYLFHLPGADTVSCTDRRQHGPCLSNCSAW